MIAKFLVFTVISVILVSSISAKTEEQVPADAIWSLFSERCGRMVTAENAGEMVAAFRGFDVQSYSTSDGALINGNASIEDDGIEAEFLIFHFNASQIDGGTQRLCILMLRPVAGAEPKGISELVEARASSLLGEDFKIFGGAVMSLKGIEGKNLLLATPDFPPTKSIYVIESPQIINLTLQVTIPD